MDALGLFFQIAGVLGIVGVAAAVLIPRRNEREEARRTRAVGQVPSHVDADEVLPSRREAAEANLRFLGLPRVRAGTVILNVPTLDPGTEGAWDARRTVLTFTRIDGVLKASRVPADLVELGGSYSIIATAGKAFLLHKHDLTTAEEKYLESQREDAVKRGDGIIEEFEGLQWKIGTACGDGSTIQVLSAHQELGKDDKFSCLPSNILDNRVSHPYYDMRARSLQDNRVLFFFYCAGEWSCFMGRELTPAERSGLKAV